MSLEVVDISSCSLCNSVGTEGAPGSPGPGRVEKIEFSMFPTSVIGKFIEQREEADTKAAVLYSSGWRYVFSLSLCFSKKLESFDCDLERLFACSHTEAMQLLQHDPVKNILDYLVTILVKDILTIAITCIILTHFLSI